jgi:hypothetical protein
VISDIFEQQQIVAPETVLWMAVIERAILDYCYPKTLHVNRKYIDSLPSFFNNTNPKPFNLEYICANLFDYDDAAKVIRKRVAKLKKCADGDDLFTRARAFRNFY